MILLSTNNASTLLGANITSGTTTVPLATGTGALFPAPGANEYFTLTLNDALTGDVYETTWCTARTGDSCTVVRGQEGSTARAWLIGDIAYNTETATSISTARAYSATNQLTLPATIPAAHQGVTQIVSSTGTITLPNTSGLNDGFLCPIVCVNNSTVVTVNTNSANVGLPNGSVINTTFSFSGTLNQITLQWDAGATVWLTVSASPNFYSGAPFKNIVTLTGAGNWTVTASAFKVTAIGGGSSGVGGQSAQGGAGGSGGGAAISYFSGQIVGSTIAYSAGAGGAATTGSPSNAGAATTFGGLTANGGAASTGSNTGGAGGSATGGQYNQTGGAGSGGFTSGGGGGAQLGGWGGANGLGQGNPQISIGTGFSAIFPGQGGGGGGASGAISGAGGNGVVIIEW